MSNNGIYDAVKKAAVAIVATYRDVLPQRPFSIIGSGFCVDPEGIIVTCEHVFKAFLFPSQVDAGPASPLRMMAPHAVFYGGVRGTEVHMHAAGIHNAVMVKDFDLAAVRVSKHQAYPGGYPTLP